MGGRRYGKQGLRRGGSRLLIAVISLPVLLAAWIAVPFGTAAATGGTVTYTSSINIPAPPASNFAGAAGGDGWALAFSSTQIFNVFHHDSAGLVINCHNQADASACWSAPQTITDSDQSFATSAMPGMYLNQSTGNVYVYVTRSDATAGVECIAPSSTGATSCGFTPLTSVGEAPLNGNGYSEISDPVQIGTNWYAFNYVNGTATGTEDKLMCFSLTTFAPCASQPYAVSFGGAGSYSVSAPAPAIAAFAGQLEIPTNVNGVSGSTLGCYDPTVAGGICPGSWPVNIGISYAGSKGTAFPLLDASGATTGFCLPTGADPCWNLDGSSVPTPAGLTSVVTSDTQWNGPALTIGPRVYVPNQTDKNVECFDYSADAGCANFPKTFGGTIANGPYTVNADPQRPTCIWVNSDSGTAQIQDFDGFTGGACTQFPIRLLAPSFIAPPAQCAPTQWTNLQVTNPFPAVAYGGGSVEFQNSDGNTLSSAVIGGSNPVNLDANGSVNLSGYDFSAANNLPDFILTFNTPPVNLTSVTVSASWEATNSSACTQPGTGITGGVTLSGPTGSATIGANQTLTASVLSAGSPVANASVTFTCVSGPCTTASVNATTDSTGAATFTYSSPTVGTDTWQASYTPSAGSAETSDTALVVWTGSPTSFTAAAAPSSTPFGNSVTLSETGLPNPATGTVTFTTGSTTLCVLTLTGMEAEATSCTAADQGPGVYPVTATYSGDATHLGSSASTAFAVSKAATTTTLTVNDAATNSAWDNSEVAGSGAYATAGVSAGSGTVTYLLYANDNCSGSGIQTTETSVGGNSDTTSPLAAGTYAYQATYGGDADHLGSTSQCTIFNVGKATPVLNSGVDDNATSAPWSGTETTGAVAVDTSAITGVDGFGAPTGTVTYSLYRGDSCEGSVLQSSTTTIAEGAVPNSDVTAPLFAGAQSYLATYSGDANYGATSSCSSFDVAQATPTVPNAVDDATSSAPWSGSEVTGATSTDTSTVSGAEGVTPIGTVTYDLYNGEGCTGSPLQSDVETLSGGLVPNSATSEALPVGTYFYQANYSGDANYLGASSDCVSFSVGKGTPTIANPVNDATTESPWSGTEVTGAQAVDTSTVTGAVGVAPNGTVTYDLFNGDSCGGSSLQSSSGLVGDAGVPASATSDALGAGTYSYQAVYSGDANYAGQSSCTSFTVGAAVLPAMGQVVDDASTSSPWTNAEATGATAADTSTLTGIEGFLPTGSVVYDLYSGPSCGGSALQSSTQDVGDGAVPDSATTAALIAGNYSFQASYSGDTNYQADLSGCQAFAVSKDLRLVGGVVYDAVSQQPWNGTEVSGGSAYATSTVTAANAGIVPTGTVTYSLFADGTCTGNALTQQTVTLTEAGTVPASVATGPLATGDYGFEASYSGDGNYHAATGNCDPFEVDRAPSLTTAVVDDAATGTAWTGAEDQGASAFDSSIIAGVSGFTPTGTVTYSFYANGSCTGPATSTHTVTLSSGTVPPSPSTGSLPPGTFSYLAVYGGDSNYKVSSNPCQSFSTGVVGYRIEGGDGGIFAFGSPFRGSVPYMGITQLHNFVGMATTTNGYWLVQSNGGVFTFGAAQYYGSVPGMGVTIGNAVGIAATADGRGYWIATSDGNVYPFGDAVAHGTLPGLGIQVNDIVGIASHESGGYWLVGRDGGVFAFGSAHFYGSALGETLGAPVVGMTPSADGAGYWLAGKDGGVFAFGDAPFHGSCPGAASGCHGVDDVVGIASADNGGYWLAAQNGAVYSFGDAQYLGSEAGSVLEDPIVGITRAPNPGS
jgi:hypothetical protein